MDSEMITFEVWHDPVVQAHGFSARSTYAEFCLATVVGPTALLALRAITARLEAAKSPITVDLAEFAAASGWGPGPATPASSAGHCGAWSSSAWPGLSPTATPYGPGWRRSRSGPCDGLEPTCGGSMTTSWPAEPASGPPPEAGAGPPGFTLRRAWSPPKLTFLHRRKPPYRRPCENVGAWMRQPTK